MTQQELLAELVALSNELGSPKNDYAILGEGNTSALADEGSFWVKASGFELGTIKAEGFVQLHIDKITEIMAYDDLSDAEIKQKFEAAKVDPDAPRPSIEALLHGLCLQLDGVNYIGHTHPTPINALTCSAAFETAVSGRIFPDEIIVLGPAPVLVPYEDPGLPLARRVWERVNAYIDAYGERPKTILMQNHGLIALGDTPRQVLNIHAMAVKWARILLGTYALGGPHFLSPAHVTRIHTRPDEIYRRKQLGELLDEG